MPSRRQALLRFYDRADQLLRIMRTGYPDRDAALLPRRTFGWTVDIHRHTVEWFRDQATCKRAAVRAHLSEHPLFPDENLDLSPRPSLPAAPRIRSTGYALYRLYDSADNLLFIGRSRQPEPVVTALRRKGSGWETTIARHTVEWFPRQLDCREASRLAHLEELPLHPDPTLDLSPPVVRPVFVYRLFDAADRLIYVGQSYRPEWRIQQHIDYRFPDIARWTTEEFPDRPSASRAERLAIATERPAANIATGGSDSVERRPVRKPWDAAQDIKARFVAGEITVRTMFAELLMFPDVTPRRAAHLLGLDDGPPPGRYQRKNRGGTVDEMLALNNLSPSATAADMPASWREDYARA